MAVWLTTALSCTSCRECTKLSCATVEWSSFVLLGVTVSFSCMDSINNDGEWPEGISKSRCDLGAAG